MTLTTAVDQTMILRGDRNKLKDILYQELTQCGWRYEVRKLCREAIKERGNVGFSVDQLVKDVTPRAREKVPVVVKRDLLEKIANSLAAQEKIEI